MHRICLLLLAGSLAAQEFEVASIKSSPPQVTNQAAIGIHVDGAQVRCNYLPLSEYLRVAYRLKDNQLSGPDWIQTERFDISAKIPEGVKGEKIPEMMQALLIERFGLKSHRESKELPVYALVPTKGGFKLQPLPPDPEEGQGPVDVTASGSQAGVIVNFGRGASFSLAPGKLEVKKLRISEFADALSRFTDRQVVDMTNTEGRYNITVDLTPDDFRSLLIRSAIKSGVTLPPEAMRLIENSSPEAALIALQTVGLKVEARKAPVDVLVVDQINRTPKDN